MSVVCNRALIVSVSCFNGGLIDRPGALRDTKKLHRVLFSRGFSTTFLIDPNAEEIQQAFHTESEQEVEECFVGVISSHGEEGVVFGSDCRAVQLSKIYSYFGGPKMAEKNKLFLVQACRGSLLDEGVELQTDSGGCEENELSECFSVPINTAVMYATAPGYSAFMNRSGSIFLQKFCELLDDDGGAELEVTRLLTRISRSIALHFTARGAELQGKKQMPCFITRLTKDFYPFITSTTKTRSLHLSATHTTHKHSIS